MFATSCPEVKYDMIVGEIAYIALREGLFSMSDLIKI